MRLRVCQYSLRGHHPHPPAPCSRQREKGRLAWGGWWSDRSDKSVVGTETNHTVVAWDCVPCVVRVAVAITSPSVLVARSPPSSPGPLLPPAGEGEARLWGVVVRQVRQVSSGNRDNPHRCSMGLCPVRGESYCCDYQSASTRCADTNLIPRPLAPASGRRGDGLVGVV